jgi:hypothetical protein
MEKTGHSDGVIDNERQGRSLDAKEQQMREEIRVLQEKRASVLQREVEELKKQKDKALSRANKLEDAVKDLQAENAALRMDSETRVSTQLEVMEQALLKEQEEKEELVRKLQVAAKQNSSLALRLKKVEGNLDNIMSRRVSRETVRIPFLNESVLSPTSEGRPTVDDSSDGDNGEADNGDSGEVKSPSTNSETGQEELLSPPEEVPESAQLLEVPSSTTKPPPSSESYKKSPIVSVDDSLLQVATSGHRPRHLPHSLRSSALLKFSSLGDLTRSLASSPSDTANNSPSLKTKRYVLASTTKRDTSTQTILSSIPSQVDLSSDTHVLLHQVDTLEVEKEVLIAQLRRTEEEKVEAGENYQKLEEKLKFLSADLDCLRQQLEVVGKWASEKMEDFQEDLDVAKIIYSLHGSLSQVRISQHRE